MIMSSTELYNLESMGLVLECVFERLFEERDKFVGLPFVKTCPFTFVFEEVDASFSPNFFQKVSICSVILCPVINKVS